MVIWCKFRQQNLRQIGSRKCIFGAICTSKISSTDTVFVLFLIIPWSQTEFPQFSRIREFPKYNRFVATLLHFCKHCRLNITEIGKVLINGQTGESTCWSGANDQHISSARRSHFPHAIPVSTVFLHDLQSNRAVLEARHQFAGWCLVRQLQTLWDLTSS